MMHLYSALLCIDVHPKRFTIMCVCVCVCVGGGGGGFSPQPPPVVIIGVLFIISYYWCFIIINGSYYCQFRKLSLLLNIFVETIHFFKIL